MTPKGIIKGLVLGTILFWVMLPWVGHTVPPTINYQGYLTDSVGTPINTTVPIVFSLYSGASGGTPLWTETQNVVVAGGVYSVNLGSVNPITLPFDVQYYLGVKVGNDQEMTPRKALTSVGYAFRAMMADNVGTHTHSGTDITSGRLNLSGTTATGNSAIIEGMNTGTGYGVKGWSGNNYGVYGYSSAVPGVFGYSAADAGVEGINGSTGNYGLLGTTDYGVYGNSSSVNGYAGYFAGSSGAFIGIDRGTDQLGGIVYREAGETQWIFPYIRGWQSDNLIVRDEKYQLDTMVFQAQTGNVGIGMTGGLLPGAKLDVNGDARIRYSLIFTDSSGTPYPQNWIGMVNNIEGTKKWLHIGGITDSGVGGDNLRRLALFADKNYFNGSVAIGKVTPSERLDVQGNIRVSGSGNGVIFPDGRKQTSRFPAPDFDSGWNAINPGQSFTLTHNVGVDVNKYFVDLQFKDQALGIHNWGIGNIIGGGNAYGAFYESLTTSTITVKRETDDWLVEQFRVRIWLYE